MFSVVQLEGNVARIETPKGMLTLSRDQLPKNVREGDLLTFTEGEGWKVDQQATAVRRKLIEEKLNRLWKKTDFG